ncbi:MAG: MBOAT family protein [Atopobiaceae bacterium]|nr:MBOAT family protein [Atopobiaceae bacterium]
MVFSSLTFLCAFLPLVFVLERACRSVKAKNVVLLVMSLVFYAYGEPALILLMLASTYVNYWLGRRIGAAGDVCRKRWMVLAVALNLATLGVFKYAGMLVQTLNALLGTHVPDPGIPLPLGISFYTFQALSYVIDVYRGEVEPQRRYARVLLYISFFPQLIAGPIVKYHDIERQMESRAQTWEGTACGLRRFCLGLSKKVLVADVMAVAADALFGLDPTKLSAPAAWLGAFAYLMQIYFDFSAYSDMAIGLGRMFGFTFKENFDHPYSSVNVQEFWRRWHMSLSTWLREYLYIPLGGNRRGKARTVLNRMTVFLLCGLWHGANWTFVVWGLLHGLALLIEEVVPLKRLPRALGHAYTLLFVMLAFVVFRADTLGQAMAFLQVMALGWNLDPASVIPFAEQLTPLFLATAVVGVLLAGSVPDRVSKALARVAQNRQNGATLLLGCSYVASFALLAICFLSLASGTYSPFIYFRF